MNELTEFGDRLVTLRNGERGLREGMVCDVKAVGNEELDFIASDETLDRYGEVVKLDGWELDEYLANPVVPDSHRYDSIAFLLGNTTQLTIKGGKMHNRVRFAMDNPLGAMAYKMASKGFIRSESVGFIPKAWTPGKTKEEPARTFTKQSLLEISLVIVPANPGATVGLALKSGAITRADLKRAIDHITPFCNEEADPAVNTSAKATGLDVARLTLLAQAAANVLRQS